MGEEAVASATTERPGLGERLRRATRTGAREAAAAFARTPLEVLLGVTAAVFLSVAIEREAMEDWTRLLVAVAIALPLTYAASALHVRGVIARTLRWAISGVVVIGAALYGFFVFDPERAAELWRAELLIGAAFAALLCVPLVRPRAGDTRPELHAFVARLAARIAIVLAYAAALWAGLALALAAVNGLFELHLPGKAWGHLASALFVLLPPWAVAAGLPGLVAPTEPWRENELRILRRVGLFLLAPLVLVYLGIVYAYTLRVLVTGEVPKNLVSPVVIGAGLLIVATTVALEPAHGDERAGGLSFLVRLAAPLLLPLVLFAMWAVSTRVDQYGWTEFRYLRLLVLVLLGVYGAAAVYRLVRRRRPPLTFVPAALAIVLLLAAVGPWSATAVARRSQSGALRDFLAASHLTGRPAAGAPPARVPPRIFRGIVDKSRYLKEHFGWQAVRAEVPWIGPPQERLDTEQLATRIGIAEQVEPGMLRAVHAHLPGDSGIPGVAGGTLYLFEARRPPEPPPPPRPGEQAPPAPRKIPPPNPERALVRIDTAATRLLVVPPGGDTLAAELGPLLRSLLQRSMPLPGNPIFGERRPRADGAPAETGRNVDLDLAPSEVVWPVLGRDGAPAGQLVLREIEFESRPAAGAATGGAAQAVSAGALRIRSAGGFVVLPAAPAPAAAR